MRMRKTKRMTMRMSNKGPYIASRDPYLRLYLFLRPVLRLIASDLFLIYYAVSRDAGKHFMRMVFCLQFPFSDSFIAITCAFFGFLSGILSKRMKNEAFETRTARAGEKYS